MKTVIKVVVETKNIMDVLPEEGKITEDFKTEKQKEELKDFQEGFAKDVHNETVESVKNFFGDPFEEYWVEHMDEQCWVEDYETLDDYGVKITTEVEK